MISNSLPLLNYPFKVQFPQCFYYNSQSHDHYTRKSNLHVFTILHLWKVKPLFKDIHVQEYWSKFYEMLAFEIFPADSIMYICTVVWKAFTSNVLNILHVFVWIASQNMLVRDISYVSPRQKYN